MYGKLFHNDKIFAIYSGLHRFYKRLACLGLGNVNTHPQFFSFFDVVFIGMS
jgi:hypothetical protein